MARYLGWVNVFACVSQQGVVSIWTKSRTYTTKKEALDAKDVPPDAGFKYVGTVPGDKLPVKVVVL